MQERKIYSLIKDEKIIMEAIKEELLDKNESMEVRERNVSYDFYQELVDQSGSIRYN